MILVEKAKAHWLKQLPFVLFRKPNENQLRAYFQLDANLYPFEGQEGFVFQSFNHEASCCLPLQQSIYSEEIMLQNMIFEQTNLQNFSIDESEKKDFEKLVFKAKKQIENKSFEKVVLSRKVTIDLSENHDIFESFKKAIATYPSAFVYLFYHSKVGLWLGATPELLLSLNSQKLETVSLAGTRLKSENLNWTTKELQEQEVVTQFIKNELINYTKDIYLAEVETIQAGQLEHLSTKITGELNDDFSLMKLLKALHPTPAVCGLPRLAALNFIKNNENYERTFYTGFLGEYLTQQSVFYVNLRCMQKTNHSLDFFVGCGITADSDPEKEFFETVNKSKTMLQIV